MKNDAIYILDLGTPDAPLSRIGSCPIAEVCDDPSLALLVKSSDAEEIYSLVAECLNPAFVASKSSTIDCTLTPHDASLRVLAACGVQPVTLGSRPFAYEVVVNRCANASS